MTPLRAVIWAAVSDPQQAAHGKDSLINQERDALAFCEREGMEIIAVLRVPGFSRDYIDIHECAEDMANEGISAFRDLLEMFKTNAFDVFVVRAGDRFGREQAIHAYIVSTIVKRMGAKIYETSKGLWIDRSNFRTYTALDGFRSASEIDEMVRRVRSGMEGRMRQGLTMNNIPSTHRLERDPVTGRALRLVVREEYRPMWDDIARLLLEGTPWQNMEIDLYERFKHVNPDTGLPWYSRTLWRLLHNPYVWGIAAKGYFRKEGLWVFDSNIPVPKGVLVERNPATPIPPLYTGELAEQVKAELRRRVQVVRGKTSPQRSYQFTGLLVCGSCGRRMNISASIKRSPSILWRCRDRFLTHGSRNCANATSVRDDIVQAQINDFLEDWLARDNPEVLVEETVTPAPQKAAFERELQTLQKRIDSLIELQLSADPGLRDNYTRKLQQAAERKAIITDQLAALETQVESPQIRTERRGAFHDLRATGLPDFWKLPPRVINQRLHRIMGRYRFIALDGKIVDTRFV
jgi:DNA invertase Pin-like site-specific DNA recombinase